MAINTFFAHGGEMKTRLNLSVMSANGARALFVINATESPAQLPWKLVSCPRELLNIAQHITSSKSHLLFFSHFSESSFLYIYFSFSSPFPSYMNGMTIVSVGGCATNGTIASRWENVHSPGENGKKKKKKKKYKQTEEWREERRRSAICHSRDAKQDQQE